VNEATDRKGRVFPAVFHAEGDSGYWVEFPDIPGCFSQGDTLEEAYRMAGEALALALDGDDFIPSPAGNITVYGEDIVMSVAAADGDDIVLIG
jgi:predicted RNase H-like HicB family nuclease